MARKRTYSPNQIYSPGTQIVTRVTVSPPGSGVDHPAGTVAEIVTSPSDHLHAYRERFADGSEASLRRRQFSIRKLLQQDDMWTGDQVPDEADLMNCVIYRCVVGSRAYGLSHDDSDVDRRGIYLPPAEMHWSLYGVPEQLRAWTRLHVDSDTRVAMAAGQQLWLLQK